MNFTLTYNGDLKPNGSIEDKQMIRRLFHRQLFELWKHTPFTELKSPSESLIKKIGDRSFFPLVSEARNEIAELQIIMLRSKLGPGYIVGRGGDIDNHLKTLFDSLRMPQQKSEIPINDQLEENEDPFFCLLEDDKLITKISVSTDRLLEPSESNSYVKLLVQVQIKKLPVIGANMIIRVGR
jgi:hypothetical protein